MDVYESVGMVQLGVKRTVGRFGEVVVAWQAIPREATTEDFQPAGGTVTITDGMEQAFINITIIDDDIPEGLQVCAQFILFSLFQLFKFYCTSPPY